MQVWWLQNAGGRTTPKSCPVTSTCSCTYSYTIFPLISRNLRQPKQYWEVYRSYYFRIYYKAPVVKTVSGFRKNKTKGMKQNMEINPHTQSNQFWEGIQDHQWGTLFSTNDVRISIIKADLFITYNYLKNGSYVFSHSPYIKLCNSFGDTNGTGNKLHQN